MLERYARAISLDEARQRLGGGRRIVKLAANENPLGASPKALAAVRAVAGLNLYSDDAYLDLRERLAARHGLRASNVIVGHGSNEIVKLAAEAILRPDDEAVMAVPSFLLYRIAVAARGATPVEVPLREGVCDLEAMLSAVTARTKLVFLCDPNNPTGTAVDLADWRSFLGALPAGVAVVVDQAYREYASDRCVDAIDDVPRRARTLVLRTMSKIYGLASLRFGYGFADEEMVELLDRYRLPFNVSAPAVAGAAAAVEDHEFRAASIENNEAGKRQIFPALAALGLDRYATEANFYALKVPVSATRAFEDLLGEGIIVRSGDALRMPGRVRITIGTPEENALLVGALERLVRRWRD
ncbi:MAG: histidinol-phosphate transaminase [Candidatus Tyrphobacter sp.]